MYDDSVPNKIDVDPDWGQITAAVNGLSAAQVSAGVLIRVRPGTLVGNGGSSNSANVMYDVGNRTWTKRVTICPRDGWGSVMISNGIRMERIRNVCLAGFTIDGKVRVRSSTRFAIAWCLVNGNIVVAGEPQAENDPKQWEFVEMVKRDVFQGDPTDPMQLQMFDGLGRHIQGVVLDGVYLAPNYMPVGHSAHQDTIQHLGFGNWMFENETIQDTVIFASNRCAVNGGLLNSTFRNCWINARKSNQMPLYPVASGADMSSGAGLSQGTKGNITFDGGVYMGKLQSNQGVDSTPYDNVLNGARIDYQPERSAAPTNGTWIVDTSMNGHTKPGYPTLPTDSYLQSIWRKGATPPTGQSASSPQFFPPGDVYDSPQTVTISSATEGAVVYYTTNGAEPTTSSQVYSSPITVGSATTLKAVAVKDGLDPSPVNVANYEIKVVTPVFLPSAGEYLVAQSITISSATQGAEIYYTTDGSTPTASSNRYTGPIAVAATSTLKAVAVKSGLPPSAVRISDYVIGGDTYLLSNDWINLTMPDYSASFEMSWNFRPTALGVDVVMGVGEEIAESYTDLACIVRFMTTGKVDARDGSSYKAFSNLVYEVNKTYRIRITVDVPGKRYSATVTPMGGSPVVIAQNYAFRTEQSQLGRFGTFAFVQYGSGGGTLSGVSLGTAGASPSRPQGLRILTE